MRARMLFAAGLVAAVAGACSNPPADTGLDIDAALEANLDLALSGGPAIEEPAVPAIEEPAVPVASPIEAPRPPEAEPKPERVRRRPAAVRPRPKPETNAPVVAEPKAEPQLAQAEEESEEPTFTLSPWPRTTDHVPEGATIPREGRGESEERGGAEDDGWHGRSAGSGNEQVIIRGGVRRRDPCAIHFPGGRGGISIGGIIGGIIFGGGGRSPLGPAGVLINERVQRVGPSQTPVLPATDRDRSFQGNGPRSRRASLR